MTIQLGWPKIEEHVAGTVDGINVQFETAKEYKAGTLVVFRNGQSLVDARDNGFEELGERKFRMKVPPVVDDIIGAYYIVNEA